MNIKNLKEIKWALYTAIVLLLGSLLVYNINIVGWKGARFLEQRYIIDPDICFDVHKVEESRRDSQGVLHCKVKNQWRKIAEYKG